MPEDMAFDDGSPVEVITDLEDPPQSGEWVDVEDILHQPTDDEIARGEFLGAVIDVDDDEDNGSQWDGFTPELLEALATEERS